MNTKCTYFQNLSYSLLYNVQVTYKFKPQSELSMSAHTLYGPIDISLKLSLPYNKGLGQVKH